MVNGPLKERKPWPSNRSSQVIGVYLRLVFTNEGVVVGVVIRSEEWCDLGKIKPMESAYDSVAYDQVKTDVGVASRSGRISQWQCLTLGLAIGWFFHFCFWLRQPSFHWIIRDGVVNGIGRNGNILIHPTPILLSLWLHLRLWFFILTRT